MALCNLTGEAALMPSGHGISGQDHLVEPVMKKFADPPKNPNYASCATVSLVFSRRRTAVPPFLGRQEPDCLA